MEGPFKYDGYVTGKNFIGRKEDCNALFNLITQGENVTLYEPPRSGVSSVTHQSIINLRMGGIPLLLGSVDIHSCRDPRDLITRIGDAIIRTSCTSPNEFAREVTQHLGGTHFRFDEESYRDTDRILSVEGTLDKKDYDAVFTLPQKIALMEERPVVILIEEFQNILLCDDGEDILRVMDKSLESIARQGSPYGRYILTGSSYNAMRYIFEKRHFFYHTIERVPLRKVEDRVIVDHVTKGFLTGGKVIEKDLVMGACKLFDGNLYYINHLMSICDSLSRGYITESTLNEALEVLTSIHEPRFKAMTNDLTTFQVRLLKALLDGVDRFSSTANVKKYGLNSSANVRRLKDALEKKEIAAFEDNDTDGWVLDPLFEYWARKFFFRMG